MNGERDGLDYIWERGGRKGAGQQANQNGPAGGESVWARAHPICIAPMRRRTIGLVECSCVCGAFERELRGPGLGRRRYTLRHHSPGPGHRRHAPGGSFVRDR